MDNCCPGALNPDSLKQGFCAIWPLASSDRGFNAFNVDTGNCCGRICAIDFLQGILDAGNRRVNPDILKQDFTILTPVQ